MGIILYTYINSDMKQHKMKYGMGRIILQNYSEVAEC